MHLAEWGGSIQGVKIERPKHGRSTHARLADFVVWY